MRSLSVISVICVLLFPVGMASAEEAAPDPGILPVPEGWIFVEMAPGGFIMEHDDGTRVQVSQCQCGGGYRVGMAISYLEGERRVRRTLFERAEGSTDMSIRIRIWPNGRREVRHLTVPWPEHIRQAFLRLLDPATRSVIHTE